MKGMKIVRFAAVFVLTLVVVASQAWASSAGPGISADEAMKLLKEGNERYVAGTPKFFNEDQARREQTTNEGQKPYVSMLSCSDSRVPVELVFDAGIGEIFVIRVAGNVARTDEAGSIEYGVDHLGTPLLVVLGHTRCGAVTAVTKGEQVHGNIPPLVSNIAPAVAKVKAKQPDLADSALVSAVIHENVWQAIEDLFKSSEVVRNKAKDGSVRVVGAMYDITSGKVDWLGPHPEQDKLIAAASGAAQPKEAAKAKAIEPKKGAKAGE